MVDLLIIVESRHRPETVIEHTCAKIVLCTFSKCHDVTLKVKMLAISVTWHRLHNK